MTGVPRNFSTEIASALGRADAQTLGALAVELLVSLSKAEATVAELRSTVDGRREKDRQRKQRVRGNPRTSADNADTSPFSPTPPFSPPASTSSSPREAEIATRLPTEAGRAALTAVLSRVSDRRSVAAEIGMILDGGRPNVSHSPAHMELALCDYAANGLSDGRFNAAHFRRHVQRAAEPQQQNGHKAGGVAQRTYDKGMEALRDGR